MSSTHDRPDGQVGGRTIPPEAVREVSEWLDLKMRTGRYSIGLAVELAWHMIARCYHVHTIYDEIGILEGADTRLSRTKAEAPFLREPLVGLWHKHHFQPYLLANNLELEILKTDIFERSIKKCLGRTSEYFLNELVHDLTIKSYLGRNERCDMTGQWIVFEKQVDGTNYYLALGSHGNKATDQALRDKVEHHREIDRRLAERP